MLRQTGDVPVCGPENMYKCSSPTLQNYTVNNLASQCQCPRQCRQLTYLHSISQAEYSNHAIEWALTNILLTNISADEIRRNYATLEVSIDFCLSPNCSMCQTTDCIRRCQPNAKWLVAVCFISIPHAYCWSITVFNCFDSSS